MYEEKLKDLCGKKRFRRDLIIVFHHLNGSYRGEGIFFHHLNGSYRREGACFQKAPK